MKATPTVGKKALAKENHETEGLCFDFDFAGERAYTPYGSKFDLASDLSAFSKRSLCDLSTLGCRY